MDKTALIQKVKDVRRTLHVSKHYLTNLEGDIELNKDLKQSTMQVIESLDHIKVAFEDLTKALAE